jgi:hypothetical protein
MMGGRSDISSAPMILIIFLAAGTLGDKHHGDGLLM